MIGSKSLVFLLLLCTLHGSLSKPFAHNVVEGRGIGSTLWGWITYPFTWWSSDVTETPPASDQLVGSNPTVPTNNIEIKPHNVTMCNTQTCTTMRCGSFGCEELVTCNIYDTDLKGDCKSYNTAVPPEEPTTSKSPSTVAKPQEDHVPQAPTTTPPVPTLQDDDQGVEERPLELEAVLSSTVTDTADKTN